MEISQKKLNDIVTNWFESYQSVIALVEGSFDPFGYSETPHNATQKEVEEAGLDWEVYQALNNDNSDVLNVFKNQIHIGMSENEQPRYELYSKSLELVFVSENLTDLVQSNAFYNQVEETQSSKTVFEQTTNLKLIVDEAMTETQSFMDDEPYWNDEEALIPLHDENLVAANDIFVNPTGDQLLEFAYELNPKDVNVGINTYEDFFDEPVVETEDDYIFWSRIGSGEASLRDFVSDFSFEHDTLTAKYGDDLDWEALNKVFHQLLEENRANDLENNMENDNLEM